MTLSEVLPTLARAAVARSFDSNVWPAGTAMDGDDILIAGRSAASMLGCGPSPDGVVVTRVTRLIRSGPLVRCDVDGPIPTGHQLLDVAWPGIRLAGARMRQLLIRSSDGVRLAARVEVPANLPIDAVIVLALQASKVAPQVQSRTLVTNPSFRVRSDQSMAAGRGAADFSPGWAVG